MKILAALRLGITLGVRTLSHLIRLLSHLTPRRQDLWVFGSSRGVRFADNARYLFLYCSTQAVDLPVRCVWITRRKAIVRQLREAGLECYHRWEWRGIWAALRAGVYIFDFRVSDITYELSGGALRINLWHGIPLKRIERDIEDSEHPINRARSGGFARRSFWHFWDPQNYERCDLVVATARVPAEQFRSAFGLDRSRVLITGYPRNDALHDAPWTRIANSAVDEVVRERLRRDRRLGYRLIFYLPTWRDQTLIDGISRDVPLPITELEHVLEAHRAKLYCKMHHVDRPDPAALKKIDSSTHVSLLPSDLDIYQLLAEFDLLITDYSSVYFDYLLLDRPIVFYPHDLAEYRELRRFYYEYEDVTPGPRAERPSELVTALSRALGNYPRESRAWRPARARVRELVHDFQDGRSSRRCLQAILDWLRNGASSGRPVGVSTGESNRPRGERPCRVST